MKSKIYQEVLDETPEDIKIFVRLYSELVIKINHLLREKNYTQAKLAERLGKSPSEIHKWLSGEHNFTLRSLAKLSAELGAPLLEVPKSQSKEIYYKFPTVINVHSACRKGEQAKGNYSQIDWAKSSSKGKSYANVG
jgi:transcriptional regulator with XRE-family HTH domain